MNNKQSSHSKQQAQLIKDFRDTTQASQKQSVQFLTRHKWNLQNAINTFFDEDVVPEREDIKSTSLIEKLFNDLSTPTQKNPNLRYMDEDKFSEFNQRYFKYADDNIVLGYILVNIMEVPTSGYIAFQNFIKLFRYLNVSDPKDLHKHSTKLEVELKGDKFAFKQMYTKMYKFYLVGNKEGSLDYAIAEELWRMYLKPIMPLYAKFMDYLQNKAKKPMKVHRDLWNMVYEFATSIKDVKEVNESDGWPVFIDEFVQYCREEV